MLSKLDANIFDGIWEKSLILARNYAPCVALSGDEVQPNCEKLGYSWPNLNKVLFKFEINL